MSDAFTLSKAGKMLVEVETVPAHLGEAPTSPAWMDPMAIVKVVSHPSISDACVVSLVAGEPICCPGLPGEFIAGLIEKIRSGVRSDQKEN